MKVLQFTNIKDFMHKLLLTDVFDHFLLSEATIQGLVTYVIDGHLTKDFFTEDEPAAEKLTGLDCAPFALLRTNCYDLIKGKRTPAGFRFVFMLAPDELSSTLSRSQSSFTMLDLNTVFLNIRFQEGVLTCTTGISYKTFSLDHSFEQYWDSLVQKFFDSHNIAYTELS